MNRYLHSSGRDRRNEKGKRAEGSTIQPADRYSDRMAANPAGGDRRRPDPGAGTMKGGEKMKEIATLKSDSEFKEFLEGFRKDADLESLKSYTSKRCQLVDKICMLDPDSVFSVRQLKEIFDLAK